ncbi:hypothetical protein [Roseibium sp.]|uniref:hypothetical protein n=1 Tax=Roseibium sp. TaxID=1936156 RepID=UPI003D1469D9
MLALTEHGLIWNDTPPASGQLSLQLAFRVSPEEVQACVDELEAAENKLQDRGHSLSDRPSKPFGIDRAPPRQTSSIMLS